MKIIEILAGDQENPIRDTLLPPQRIPDRDLMAHIANVFTNDRVVKLLWDLHIADEAPAPETSGEDTGTSHRVGGTRPDSSSGTTPMVQGRAGGAATEGGKARHTMRVNLA
jgi:hypothetical protein